MRKPIRTSQVPKMGAVEAKKIITELFGERGQLRAAEALKRTNTTISRWCSGHTPVRPLEAQMLRMLSALNKQGVDWEGMMAAPEAGVAAGVEDLI